MPWTASSIPTLGIKFSSRRGVKGGIFDFMKAFSIRHERFVQEFFVNGGNSSAAYRAAGFRSIKNVDKQASKVFKRADVQEEIQRRSTRYREATEMGLNEALGILSGIATDETEKSINRIRAVLAWARMTGNEGGSKRASDTKCPAPSISIFDLIIQGMRGAENSSPDEHPSVPTQGFSAGELPEQDFSIENRSF